MVQAIVDTFTTEQRHDRSPYWFIRENCPKSDTLPMGGHGRPVNTTGMTWSGFRPSDDACKFGYLIPSNMMAVVALGYAAELLQAGYADKVLEERCRSLAEEIRDGIETYGVYGHPKYGRIYAYETDGFGNYNLMDDANSPSLLAIPYLATSPRRTLSTRTPGGSSSQRTTPTTLWAGPPRASAAPTRPTGTLAHRSSCRSSPAPTPPKSGSAWRPWPAPTPGPALCTRASTPMTPQNSPGPGSPGPTRCLPKCWNRRFPYDDPGRAHGERQAL